jgi:hypothetical protein
MSTTEPRQESDIDRDIKTPRIKILRDAELDAVTGGSKEKLEPFWFVTAAKAIAAVP